MRFRKGSRIFLVVCVLLIGISLSSLMIPATKALDYTLFHTNNSNNFGGIGETWQNTGWYSDYLFWQIVDDDSNVCYITSSDGDSWSDKTVLMATRSAGYLCLFSLVYNVTRDEVSMVYAGGNPSEPLIYRMGTPNPDGTITWAAAWQTVRADSPDYQFGSPCITIDSNGYPWIASTEEVDWALTYPFVYKSSTNDGTWTEEFATQLNSTQESWQTPMAALPNGMMMVFYGTNDHDAADLTFSRLWNGTAWGDAELVGYNTPISSVGCCSYGNEVYFAWRQWFREYTIGSGWDTVEDLGDGTAGSLGVDVDSGNIFRIWNYISTTTIYVHEREGDTWKEPAALLDWADEFGWGAAMCNCWRDSSNGRIGIVFSPWDEGSPYNYYFFTIDIYLMYYFHGVYDEDGFPLFGDPYNQTYDVTIYQPTIGAETFTLNGTAVYPTLENGTSCTFHLQYANETRHFDLRGVEEVYVFKPNPDHNTYFFDVFDMVGITNGYLESIMNINGTDRVVERWRLDSLNDIPFIFSWGYVYRMRIVCDEGTITYGSYIGSATTQQSLYVTSADFPPEATHIGDISLFAKRQNSTWLQGIYDDEALQTNWVSFTVYELTGSTVIDTTNNTGNTHTYNFYSAEANTDYRIVVEAGHDVRADLSYTIPLPAFFDAQPNPWWTLDFLGTVPWELSQSIGIGIILLIYGAGTAKSAPVMNVVAVLIAALLTVIGWLTIDWTWLAMSMTIAILTGLSMARSHEGKQ